MQLVAGTPLEPEVPTVQKSAGLGNPQGKTQDLELAWLAGFIDADGSLYMGKNNQGGNATFIPKIKIVNTHQPTIERIVEMANRMELPIYVSRRYRHPDQRATRRDYSEIVIQGMKRVLRWLVLLLPYLYTKREQAELLVRWCEIRFAKENRKAPYTQGELDILAKFRGSPENPQRLNAASGRQTRDDTVRLLAKA